jgi:hypothetical protein
MDIKNEEWYLPLVNKIDIDEVITEVAESHGWNDDERWSIGYDDEFEEYCFLNSQEEWFSTYFHFAESEAIENIKNQIDDILKEDYDLELEYEELYEIAQEILNDLY